MSSLKIIQPDDWHLHLRDGRALPHTVPATSRCFGRAIVMPNLVPPVTNVDQAAAYKDRIVAATPETDTFEPLMTLYLTDNTTEKDIRDAAASGFVAGCKLYPAGATTNSDSGVTNIANIDRVLDVMADCGLPLLVHGEVTDSHIDIFDREKVFIDNILRPLVANKPSLRAVLEHITTKDAVEFVREAPENVAATITPHHLMFNRNHMLVGGIRPHFYCLPILKRDIHQQALREAATSGNPKFFLGTDSAPHARNAKESACGCAGCFSAFAAIELYAEVFEQLGALDKLENFASVFGPQFYRRPVNSGILELVKESWDVPAQLPFGEDSLVPVKAGETIGWRVKAINKGSE